MSARNEIGWDKKRLLEIMEAGVEHVFSALISASFPVSVNSLANINHEYTQDSDLNLRA